jgi:hypothetical protein
MAEEMGVESHTEIDCAEEVERVLAACEKEASDAR